ncbi:MAG: hypothetical protein Q4A71_02460 [Actinomycetaceae bacterium]|nr:hypothetical protein [Actinomycetaceae bacterium]
MTVATQPQGGHFFPPVEPEFVSVPHPAGPIYRTKSLSLTWQCLALAGACVGVGTFLAFSKVLSPLTLLGGGAVGLAILSLVSLLAAFAGYRTILTSIIIAIGMFFGTIGLIFCLSVGTSIANEPFAKPNLPSSESAYYLDLNQLTGNINASLTKQNISLPVPEGRNIEIEVKGSKKADITCSLQDNKWTGDIEKDPLKGEDESTCSTRPIGEGGKMVRISRIDPKSRELAQQVTINIGDGSVDIFDQDSNTRFHGED